MQVMVKGQEVRHAIALAARGGFKWADPDVPVPPGQLLQLLPGTAVGTAEEAALLGLGSMVAGVREATVVTLSVEVRYAVARRVRQRVLRRSCQPHFACGSPAGPLRLPARRARRLRP